MFLKEWKQVLSGAWSVKLMLANLILLIVAWWETTSADLLGLDPATYFKVGVVISGLGVLARIVKQPKLAARILAFLAEEAGAVDLKALFKVELIPNWSTVMLHSRSATALILLVLVMPNVYDIFYLAAGRDLAPWSWWLVNVALGLWGVTGRPISEGIWDGIFKRRWPRTIFRYLVWLLIIFGFVSWASRASAMSDVQPYPAVSTIQVATEDQLVEYCAPFVAEWEGLRLKAYMPTPIDRPTIGFGATHINGVPVKMGDTITKAQAIDLLEDHLRYYRRGLHEFLTVETIKTRLPITRDCSFTSFPLNVGIRGAGGSTATARLNAGWVEGACAALGWWNKQGGRVLPGLVNRRAAETRLCMIGVG